MKLIAGATVSNKKRILSQENSSLLQAIEEDRARKKQQAKEENFRRIQEDIRIRAEEEKRANENLKFWEGVKKYPIELGAAALDIAERTSPIESARNIISGVREVFQGEKSTSTLDRYKKGVLESQARETRFEKVRNGSLTNDDGTINWKEGRMFVGRAAEIPTLAYGGIIKPAALAGKNILQRVFSRSLKSLPEAGVNTAIQTFEEGKTENVGTNLLLNSLLISGIGNISGEIKLNSIAKSIRNIEKETGTLDREGKDAALDALYAGVKEDEIIQNAKRIKAGEVTPSEVETKINDFTLDISPEERLLKDIASSEDELKISELIKGKVPDEQIPAVSKALKSVSDENEVSRILDEYNPEKVREELALRIATTDSEKKIASMLKGVVSERDIPSVSKIFKNMEDEVQIQKILKDFEIKKTDVKISEKKSDTFDDPRLSEARKYGSAEEFVKAKMGAYQPPEFFAKEELARRSSPLTHIDDIDTDKIIDTGYKNLPNAERNSIKSALNDRNKSDITVFRATDQEGLILPGSYVALDKSHAEKYLGRGGKLIETKIPKKDLYFNDRAGDFVYAPNGQQSVTKSQLTDLWKKARGGKTAIPIKNEIKKESIKTQPIKPITEGKKTESGLARTTLEQAVEAGILREVKDTPQLGTMNMEEQAKRAVKLLGEDYDRAIRIVFDGEDAPEGLKRGSVYIALREQAISKNDYEMIQRLALSDEVNSFARAVGQEVKAFDGSQGSDIVRVFKEVVKLKEDLLEASGKNAKEEVKKTLKEMDEIIEKTSSGDEGFESFIKSIKC